MAGLLGDVLPYVYSRGNALQRMLGGLLSDPVGTAQQAGGLLRDNARQQENLLAQAFQDPRQPFRVTDSNALQQASMNALSGLLGFAPAGVTVFRAGSPKGMTADAGGPTFYATEAKGAQPFARDGAEVKEYNINPQTVLDTQLKKYRDIYEQFMRETGASYYGYGTSGRPFWTSEHNLKKWLDSKGHKFDAVMFDEPTGVPSYAVYAAPAPINRNP